MKRNLTNKGKTTCSFLNRLSSKGNVKGVVLAVFCFTLCQNPAEARGLNPNPESGWGLNGIGTRNLQMTVAGKVVDKSGQPLPGVTVVVKGTTRGTVTDPEGAFSLPNVEENAVLVFSYVGMLTREVPVAGKASISVTLEEDAVTMNEVVVVGYATRKAEEVTGSISTVKAEELQKSSNTNVAKSLAGRVPGLIVVDRGGAPGSNNVTMLIRGKSTLGDNSPLIVVDGVPANSLSFLAPATSPASRY